MIPAAIFGCSRGGPGASRSCPDPVARMFSHDTGASSYPGVGRGAPRGLQPRGRAPCLESRALSGPPSAGSGCRNSTWFRLGLGGRGSGFPCSWRNYRPTCCQEAWLGEASAAPSRRAGGGTDGNSIAGSADCLIYFKIKQMAAPGVCLSSARSRARGQEPRGSCAKNFSMTLVVKPPLPSFLNFSLTTHMSAF